MRDFLLEIGIEEIPATHLQPALDYIRQSFEKLMGESGLPYASLQCGSTPRRFFLLAESVCEKQEDIRVNRTGPAKKIAYDDAGNLLPAALGFLKKNSASAEDLYIETTDKGEFIALNYIQPGRNTAGILRDWIIDLIPRIPFPKTMIWNSTRLALSRPLRWLCVLWGEDVLDLEAAGIRSGRMTFGNRYLGLDRPITVNSPSEYLEALRGQAVLADRQERRSRLVRELGSVALGEGQKVIPDERLADTVTDLVEYPTAVVAQFKPEFLRLPEKIITSTISQNQKYFSVQNADGSLADRFVFISNGDPACSAIIRKGNEKVVAARLADALWYYREDTKRPLDSFLPHLDEVVFQSRLGTMADKTRRIRSIADYICRELALGSEETALADRTAQLCKADLVTTMLGEKEFTKLQGYIGKQYALASGEPEVVAQGIYEHYMPRGTNDGLPESLSGAIVAVADKLDSVCGIIGIGLLPTGSADPFALRRAANGVVQIIVERGWSLDFSNLIAFALDQVRAQTELSNKAVSDVEGFFHQRVEWLLRQLDLDYDVIDSLTHLSLGDLPDLKLRAVSLQSYRTREDFIRLVIGFKRVSNIINGEESFAEIKPDLFESEQEKELHTRLQDLRNDIDAALAKSDYAGAIGLLISFGKHIDSFFDDVLVNCDDLAIRANRYALLHEVKDQFLRVADISKIVLEIENNGV
jgi:glycyl-tRNA synthetase beta chain